MGGGSTIQPGPKSAPLKSTRRTNHKILAIHCQIQKPVLPGMQVAVLPHLLRRAHTQLHPCFPTRYLLMKNLWVAKQTYWHVLRTVEDGANTSTNPAKQSPRQAAPNVVLMVPKSVRDCHFDSHFSYCIQYSLGKSIVPGPIWRSVPDPSQLFGAKIKEKCFGRLDRSIKSCNTII